MLGGGKQKRNNNNNKKIPTPKPESCPEGLVASDPWLRAGLGPLRALVSRGRRGRRPRRSGAPAPPNRIGFGEGKPAEKRSSPAGEDETWSLPAAPALSRPARLSLPSCLGGFRCFSGSFTAPQVRAAGLGPPTWSSRDGDPRLPRHGGGLGPPAPAGEQGNGHRAARDPLKDRGGWEAFRGLTSCAHG